MHPLAYLPSPSQSVWHLGPLPIRAYALCIVAGIVLALWMAARRMRARGGRPEDVWDVAGWAIVLGIIGGRLYHVVTDPELYFSSKHWNPLGVFKIWDGGLGIWGAIALGVLGAWIGCRRKGISLLVFADAAAPGVVLAQALGRWGNWFNNELYGGPTSLPWGLQIHCLDVSVGHAVASTAQRTSFASGGEACPIGSAVLAQHYQPTFLYECLWDIAVAVAILYLDRRFRLGRGNVFALYVMGYTAGRCWIETLRTDHANHILGLRLNVWTCIVVFLLALAWFVRHGGFAATREPSPYTRPRSGSGPSGPPAVLAEHPDDAPAPVKDAPAPANAPARADEAPAAEASGHV